MDAWTAGQESAKSAAPEAAFQDAKSTITEESGKSQVGNSGHSKCRKFRFSSTLTSIFTGLSIILPAKDFYLEKFGAHPVAMGVIFFIVSFLTPFQEMLSGRLQNRSVLRRWFSLEAWGRKAPWLLTHTVVLAAACGILYLPPHEWAAGSSDFVLHAWFFIVSVITFWTVSTTIIAFESARQEIYPYNEERSQVEMFCKITCTIGIGYGMAPMLVLLANPALSLRVAASAFWLVGVLVFGLQAKPIWLEAKSISTEEETSVLRDLKECWKSTAFRHLCLARLYDGLYQGIFTTNLLYYLTYILQLHGVERSGWLVLVGFAAIGGEFVMATYVARRLKERQFQFQLQSFIIKNRALNCLAGIVFLIVPVILYGDKTLGKGSREINMTRVLFLVWATVNRFFQSPFTFWRVGAQCWVIDEDIHETSGVRREAAFISVFSAAQNFARALSSAVVFLGYGLAGLSTRNCEAHCKDNWNLPDQEFESLSDCTYDCLENSINGQPESLRLYIRGIFLIGLTICDVFVIVHAIAFPIKGIRLARLYNNQALSLGGKIKGIYSPEIWRRTTELTPQEMVAKQFGESKIMRMDCNAEAGIEHVNMIMSHGAGKAVSASVVFTLPECKAGFTDIDFICNSSEGPVAGALRDHLIQHPSFVRNPVSRRPRSPDSSRVKPPVPPGKRMVEPERCHDGIWC